MKTVLSILTLISIGVIVFCAPTAYHQLQRFHQKTIFIGAIPVPSTTDGAATSSIDTSPVLFSPRILSSLTIPEMVPHTGKFIAADLPQRILYLYQDGTVVNTLPIKTIGRAGTPWETPAGLYTIKTKERSHYSSIGHVTMPYSMQFYGNYFIHGWPKYPNGTPVATSYSGGCIRLADPDAAHVYAFADVGTQIFVYDPQTASSSMITMAHATTAPTVSARSFLVADIDTGTVFIDHNADQAVPLGPLTRLVTALVANETISFEKNISVTVGSLSQPYDPSRSAHKQVLIGSLLYPELMDDSSRMGTTIASTYGANSFLQWMNATAYAFDMHTSMFTDPSGTASSTVSDADDVFRLASYLYHKKSFILDIYATPDKTVLASDGTTFHIVNTHLALFATSTSGTPPVNTPSALVITPIPQYPDHHVAVIVLDSSNTVSDIQTLKQWIAHAPITAASTTAGSSPNTACAACAVSQSSALQPLRVIDPL